MCANIPRRKMSATQKVMAVLVLVLAAVAMAASTDGNKNKTNSSHAQHVGSLVAKARLSPVNAITVNNNITSTESKNSTAEKTVTKRSLGSIDKSDGTSR